MSDRTDAPALGPVEFARWIWRQLTSMRTALFLLFLLALAAIPGSVIPQDNVDSILSAQWRTDHKTLTPIYEKLQLFNVYSSVWFSAIYILLLISLVGCVLPRLAVYARGLGAKPPAAPKNLAAVASEGAINLIWEANTEGDLAGYMVLRAPAVEGGKLVPITPAPIKETTFRDTKVRAGVRYAYVVVAVDTATPQNVSAQSNRVEETAR